MHPLRVAMRAALALALGLAGALAATGAHAQSVLRVVMHSDLKIADPIWTTGYITRNHGYMIYDTLFATDAKGEIRPQMVDTWAVSPDQLAWTFTLRDGLLFHDDKPVTAEDVVASLKRWSARDATGQKLWSFVKDIRALDAKTFRIDVNGPTGLMLQALGKPSILVPFIMPKRIADTPPGDQIKEYVGSGPFVFKTDEWKPGEKAVYVKFAKYKPRAEPASGLAGGKLARLDRVEWRWIPDMQTAVNALRAGEIDLVELPAHDMLPTLAKDANVKLVDTNPLGGAYSFRPNVLHKPLDNPKVRQAVMMAFVQEDFLKGMIGDPRYYKVCKAYFICDTPFGSTRGMDGMLEGNARRARELLKEAGYDGTPLVIPYPTDLKILADLAPIAKAQLERVGMKVELQAMDWQSLLARLPKRDAPAQGGWSAYLTGGNAADALNPMGNLLIAANCEKARPGWPCDPGIEKLRDDFAREGDAAKQKAIAEALQQRLAEYVPYIPLGQWYQPTAMRTSVSGMLVAPVPVFWNVEKAAR
jgi:peptide/nickel transport system substrate-binding protein